MLIFRFTLIIRKTSKRIQHQYFGVDEVQEEEDTNTHTPFQICGVLEGTWMHEQREISFSPNFI